MFSPLSYSPTIHLFARSGSDSISNQVTYAGTYITANHTTHANADSVTNAPPYPASHATPTPVVRRGRLGDWICFVGCARGNMLRVEEALRRSRNRHSKIFASFGLARVILECHGGVGRDVRCS